MEKNLNQIEADEITERDNLAVTYVVERLEPIPNKDRIELVHLRDCGYTTVCEKIHSVGDLVVFIKYDSIVPQNELFEFMRETKFRVKAKSFTIRDEEDNVVDKMYSQGIVLPIKAVIDFTAKRDCNDSEIDKEFQENLWEEGDDLTQLLEVKKYVPPVMTGAGSSFGVMASKGDFPTHIISKTDEVNLASGTRALELIQGKAVYITQKIEGSSMTIFWDDERDELMVCSRNNQIGEHETNKFWQAANKYDLRAKLKHFPDVVIQAECYGEGIQRNHLAIEGVDLAVFNVSSKLTRERYTYEEMKRICEMLNVPMVKEVCYITNFDMTFDQLQELSDSQRYDSGYECEGIVIRPAIPFSKKFTGGEPWSFKVISREYKL